MPIPVAAPSEESVCNRWLPGIAGSNPAWGHGYFSLVTFVLSSRVLCVGLIARTEEWCVQWVWSPLKGRSWPGSGSKRHRKKHIKFILLEWVSLYRSDKMIGKLAWSWSRPVYDAHETFLLRMIMEPDIVLRGKAFYINYSSIIRYIVHWSATKLHHNNLCNWKYYFSTRNFTIKFQDFYRLRKAPFPRDLSYTVVLLIRTLQIYFVAVSWLAWKRIHSPDPWKTRQTRASVHNRTFVLTQKEARNSERTGILPLSIARRQKHRPRLTYSKLMAFVISVLFLSSIVAFFLLFIQRYLLLYFSAFLCSPVR
jgi:hypothetical protein